MLTISCAARTELLDRCKWNTREPVMIPSHAAAETAVNDAHSVSFRSSDLR